MNVFCPMAVYCLNLATLLQMLQSKPSDEAIFLHLLVAFMTQINKQGSY